MTDTTNGDDAEVQRLKNLVKDLEQQNSALRSQKTPKTSNTSQSLDSSVLSASSDDGDDEFIDLSSACGLDDDVSWLYISPSKYEPSSTTGKSSDSLKRCTLSVFESPEVLPIRRALSHKLRDIERAERMAALLGDDDSEGATPVSCSLLFPARSTPAYSGDYAIPNASSAPAAGVTSPGRVSLNGSYTSDPGYNSANNTSNHMYSSDNEGVYSNGATNNGSYHDSVSGSASGLRASPLLVSAEPAYPFSSPSSTYSTGTFTRPKKKPLIAPPQTRTQEIDNNSDSDADIPALDCDLDSDDVMTVNVQPPTPTAHDPNISILSIDESTKYIKNIGGAGDSSTFIRRPRNQTRVIEGSAVLEAQRLMSDSPNSLEQSESDSVSALPDETFRRRPASGHNQDKSKRESLDIQTLAKLQEQSLRDSLQAVRKASVGSTGSGGIPALGLSDLDSSNGSISSSNDEAFHQNAEEKANQGSGTFRIHRRSPRQSSSPSPTLELNGDTPIIHKPVVNTRSAMPAPSSVGSGRRSPQIKSSLSPRSIQSPRASGIQKPRSSLPAPTSKIKPRSGGIPTPRGSGLRPPSNTQYSNR